MSELYDLRMKLLTMKTALPLAILDPFYRGHAIACNRGRTPAEASQSTAAQRAGADCASAGKTQTSEIERTLTCQKTPITIC